MNKFLGENMPMPDIDYEQFMERRQKQEHYIKTLEDSVEALRTELKSLTHAFEDASNERELVNVDLNEALERYETLMRQIKTTNRLDFVIFFLIMFAASTLSGLFAWLLLTTVKV